MRSILRALGTWLVFAASCAALAAAAQDLPTRVGRVAYIEGGVSIYQDPDFGWDQAYVNSPITSRNSLWTDAGARAEMRVGGLALRLGELTQLDVSHLDDDGIDATVQQGALALRVRHFEGPQSYRFSTPDAQFRLLADGRYRIDADAERGESRLVVFSGRAVLQSADGDVRVNAGDSIIVGGGTYGFERASEDDLDRWAESRDRAWVENSVTRYVAPDITGYEELDAYGTWIDEPGYGALWMPTRVGSDWVPYREGRWAWVRPWGWTWISAEPWGYAPFHYGRWVHVRDRWCWYPGRRVDRQAWAPALVGWIGGSGFNVTVRGGNAPALGWYPLAPEETFHPWYRASSRYVNRVNVITHTVDDRRRDRHEERPREVNRNRGATVVPRETFLRERPVAQNVVNVPPQVVQQHAFAAQPPANVLPSRNEVTRERPAQQQRPAAGPGPAHGNRPNGTAPAAPAANPFARAPAERPSFARPSTPPAPHAAPNGAPPHAAPAPSTNGSAATPANPFGRGGSNRENRGAREAPHTTPPAQQPPAPNAPPPPQPHPSAPAATPTPPAANPFGRPPAATPAPPAANPFGRAPEHDERGARDAQQRNEQQRQQQERASREAQQREAQQREAQQREAQQRAAEQQRQQQQQQQRAAEQQRQQQQQQQQRAAEQQRQQQQQQERAAREAQQREAQQRAAEQQRQQQQQQQQERAAREAQQRAAEQQRQQQQQQERAAREAQQREAQQRAAEQQRQQQQQRAAEQQQRQQQQQQERAAREAQQRAEQAKPQPPQSQRPPAPPAHTPEKREHEPPKDDHGSGG